MRLVYCVLITAFLRSLLCSPVLRNPTAFEIARNVVVHVVALTRSRSADEKNGALAGRKPNHRRIASHAAISKRVGGQKRGSRFMNLARQPSRRLLRARRPRREEPRSRQSSSPCLSFSFFFFLSPLSLSFSLDHVNEIPLQQERVKDPRERRKKNIPTRADCIYGRVPCVRIYRC